MDELYKAQFNPANLKTNEDFAQFKEIQVSLRIRDIMRGSYSAIPSQWDAIFAVAAEEKATVAPLLSVPVPIPVAVAVGVAAVVINNPTVTRRLPSWFGG